MPAKIKLDCPVNFLQEDLADLLKEHNFAAGGLDSECVIVDPGTKHFLGEYSFTKYNNLKTIEEPYFGKYKNLKVVGTPSTGTNHLDLDYLTTRGIKVFCLLDDRESLNNIQASAEFTWLHIMNAVRKFTLSIKYADRWRMAETYLRSRELSGKKIGIIGFGRIGKKIAKYSEAFGLEVKYYDPYVQSEGHKSVDSIQQLKDCDIISINCYLTDETKNLISDGVFDSFKKGLVVVNTSRGEVVDEEYIYELVSKKIIFYSCDVLCNEQNLKKLKGSKLMKINPRANNLVITPHVAGATIESQTKALKAILKLCQNV